MNDKHETYENKTWNTIKFNPENLGQVKDQIWIAKIKLKIYKN
jgi:hypothetical protein